MKRLTIELAGLPPSPNRTREHTHWAARSKLVKEWREAAWAAALQAKAEIAETFPWSPVSLSATFILPDRRRRDPGNLVGSEGLKAAIDGLVDARVIPDDSLAVIYVYGPFSFELGRVAATRITVTAI